MTKRKIRTKFKKLYPSLIFISILFMSIGYAIINSVILKLDGTVLANLPNGVLISQAKYIKRTNALEKENATILTHNSTTLSTNITLQPNNETSQVSIEVTFYNNSLKTYILNDISYNSTITGTYSNPNIKYTIEDKDYYSIAPGETIIATITFSYKEEADLTQNTLSSILKFEFVEYVAAIYKTKGIYEFTAPETGTYKLETWGASGGDTTLPSADLTDKLHMEGGNGGYSSGEIELTKGEKIYVVVGGEGNGSTVQHQSLEGGYNGGGDITGHTTWNHYHGSGGGATHIAKVTGLLQDLYNNKNQILLVAGGGGGSRNQSNNANTAARYGNGGAGGGLTGIVGVGYGGSGIAHTCASCAAGQTGAAELFGKGKSTTGNAAGGGGYYGGESGDLKSEASQTIGAGSGGSGYIDGTLNGNSIPGNQPIPSINSLSSIIGNDGGGNARITLISSTQQPNITTIHNVLQSKSSQNETANIISYVNTSLTTEIKLAANTQTSKATLVATLRNNSNYPVTFNSISHNSSNYTNTNIKYTYNQQGTVIEPFQTIDITINFNYIDTADLTQNTLTSTLIFNTSIKTTGELLNLSNGIAYQNDETVTLTGTGIITNDDNSITFVSETNKTNAITFTNLPTDFSQGFSLALDFYTNGYILPNATSTLHYEILWSARKVTDHGTTAWYGDNGLLIDIGGNLYRHTIALKGAGRYLIILTYGNGLNGFVVLNKETKQVITNQKGNYNLNLINTGLSLNNNSITIGADPNRTNDNRNYQSTDHIKFYNFYINNRGLNTTEFNNLLNELNYTGTVDLTPLQ